jgi:hypothetical protein
LVVKSLGGRPTLHGEAGGGGTGRKPSKEYRAWINAKARCYNPKNASFEHYGERGIGMAPAWRDNFGAFLADVGRCPPGLTLDRIDTDGDYAPGNCRWATYSDQNRTRRRTALVVAQQQAAQVLAANARRGSRGAA